jgi:hypothetical protein
MEFTRDDSAAWPAWPAMESAVSTEARAIREALGAIRESLERSYSLFGPKAALIAEIWSLVSEGSPNGEDEAVVDWTAWRAESFVRALPEGLPLPEVAREPDGGISLDWIRSRDRMFSVSVTATGRLGFAWLDGVDRGHGVARFDGGRLPRPSPEGITGLLA